MSSSSHATTAPMTTTPGSVPTSMQIWRKVSSASMTRVDLYLDVHVVRYRWNQLFVTTVR
ncbi:hypothetical protein K440DRAFT_615026 [Wilcoxina mikolae CBS 423.85]|nr:hypothetical protein K440DRAFT_615026 [Wilcoxina mikolae CBS 423.85]